MNKLLVNISKKAFLIVSLVVLVLVILGSFILVKFTTQPLSLPKIESKKETVVPEKKRVEILYDGVTFNPKSVSLNLGDSISVKNKSTAAMEIAMGKHPSHQELKGFEEKVVKRGEDYTFTIEEKGQFEFHDHLKPKVLGVITVN